MTSNMKHSHDLPGDWLSPTKGDVFFANSRGAIEEKSDTRGRMSLKSGPKRLRELLQRPGIIFSLGAHDVFTALCVGQAGFETVFIGGFGTSASMLGLPDLNFLTMSEMADAVRRMAARVCIPVIADADTGYGDLHNVQRTVEAFEAAGTSGILLEDQVMPQRCGHFADKQVIPSEEMVLKIKAAVKVKSDPAFVIFARTAARQMNGLDDAIDRVNRCCDSGADIAFIEAPESRAELEEIAGGHGRTLINSIDPGTTFRVSFPLSGAQQEDEIFSGHQACRRNLAALLFGPCRIG